MKIIVDTREQLPWSFDSLSCEIINSKLDTGDYSLEGYEEVVAIERKKSVSEIAGNITEKRFWREMERMREIRHSFLFLEFGYEDIANYPENMDVSKKIKSKIRVRGPFIMKELSRIQVEFGVHVVMCGHKYYAEQAAVAIFKRVLEEYNYECKNAGK